MRSHNKRFFTNPGNPLHKLFAPKVMPDGSVDLVEAGVENTDDIIQSYAESTDIRLILASVSQGDYSGLQARSGSYGDFTQVPSTFAEALQLQIDSNRLFSSLPVEIRDKFDQDPNKFFASAGSADWIDKLGDILPESVRDTFKPSDGLQPVPGDPNPVEK